MLYNLCPFHSAPPGEIMRHRDSREQRHATALEAARQREVRIRAGRFQQEILLWLQAMEKYHNLSRAPMRPFTPARCTSTSDGIQHWNHVRLLPDRQQSDRVYCVSPRDIFPDEVLRELVILPLRQAGFTVEQPTFQGCGCTTFVARPRKLAGR